MGTITFWKQLAERAAKSAAQALILLWAADAGFNVLTVNLTEALGLAGGAAVLSALTSIATAGTGQPNSPSAVKIDQG
jgi:hypothetical protein